LARGQKATAVDAGPVEGLWDLPEDWRWERIGDCLPLEYGKALSAKNRSDVGNHPVYGSSGQVGTHDATLTEGPTIVVGRKGSAGAVHFSPVGCWPIDTAYFVRPRAGMDLRYAYHLLTHLRLGKLDQSTAIPSLSRDNYSELVVPVPHEDLQPRIAACIDALFAEIDEGEAALADARAGVETYRKALLKAAVTGELTADWRASNPPEETGEQLLSRILTDRRARWHADPKNARKKYVEPAEPDTDGLPILPEGWVWANVQQLSTLVTSGSRGWSEFYADSGSLFIRAANLNQDRLDLSEVAFVQVPNNSEGARTKVVQGDFLITITGANVTKCGVVTEPLDDAYVSQHVGLVRPVTAEIGRYLYLWSRAYGGGKQYLEGAAYGAGKPGLNLPNIYEMAVALPPFAEIAEIEERMRRAQNRVPEADLVGPMGGQLRQSILAAAFRGELAV
jgi:type I restriction enzyme, S subunit